MIYVVIVLGLLLLFFTARQFVRSARKSESWQNYVLLPGYFFIGIVLFSAMMPSHYLVRLLFLLNTIFLYYYLRAVYHRLTESSLSDYFSLENLSAYGNFTAFYFLASAIYGFQVFLNISVWILIIFLIFITALMVYQTVWINRIDRQIGFFYLLIICLVLAQLGWAISFLPLSFYILGLIMAIYYYILTGISRYHMQKKLENKIVKLYLGFGLISLIAVLATARWM